MGFPWLSRGEACSLGPWSSTFLAPGTSLMEDSFSTDRRGGDGFRRVSAHYMQAHLLLCVRPSSEQARLVPVHSPKLRDPRLRWVSDLGMASQLPVCTEVWPQAKHSMKVTSKLDKLPSVCPSFLPSIPQIFPRPHVPDCKRDLVSDIWKHKASRKHTLNKQFQE